MDTYVYAKTSIPANQLQLNDVGIVFEKQGNIDLYKVKFLRLNVVMDIHGDDIEEFDVRETGDRYKYKVCDRCFKRLDTETYFSNNRIKKDNVITKRPSCKSCRKIKDGKSISASDRALWNLKKPRDYEPFTCPICDKTSIVGITKIVLDHSHKTGKVRGYLCESCNTGIGRFDDDASLITKAISWLQKD